MHSKPGLCLPTVFALFRLTTKNQRAQLENSLELNFQIQTGAESYRTPRSATESPNEVKMDDQARWSTPLVLQKTLIYLSLKERIKLRVVSRGWRNVIDTIKVSSLCVSNRRIDFIVQKRRWVSGEFAWNFISSSRIDSFFQTFHPSILSQLQHLRLCDFDLSPNSAAMVKSSLNLFGQLEELDIIRFHKSQLKRIQVKLCLPMLRSIQLCEVTAILRLTLDAPRLQSAKVWGKGHKPILNIVRHESIETLISQALDVEDVEETVNLRNFKNLKYLCTDQQIARIDLSGLPHLKEVHLNDIDSAVILLKQLKEQPRADRKIFLFGLHLNGPEDPAIGFFETGSMRDAVDCLTQNFTRLAAEIPFKEVLDYSVIQGCPSNVLIPLLKRCTDLRKINLSFSLCTNTVEGFLDILQSLPNITELIIVPVQPTDLLDRLPDYCPALQELAIWKTHPQQTYEFLLKFNDLVELHLIFLISARFVQTVLEHFRFLLRFEFCYGSPHVREHDTFFIVINHHPRQFEVTVLTSSNKRKGHFQDVNPVLEFIVATSELRAGQAN